MSIFEVKAELRDDMGKGASRRLRHADKFPAVLYGNKKQAIALTIAHTRFLHQLEDEAFYSSVLTLTVGDNKEKVVLKDLQRHPYKAKILHADFQRINDATQIEVHVPLHFTHEDQCIGVKQDGGNISHRLSDILISCLPKDLPEYIEVDMTEMHIGQSLHLSDLTLPEGISIHGLEKDSNSDLPVVTVVKSKVG